MVKISDLKKRKEILSLKVEEQVKQAEFCYKSQTLLLLSSNGQIALLKIKIDEKKVADEDSDDLDGEGLADFIDDNEELKS